MIGIAGSHRWRPVRSITDCDVVSQTGAYVVFFAGTITDLKQQGGHIVGPKPDFPLSELRS